MCIKTPVNSKVKLRLNEIENMHYVEGDIPYYYYMNKVNLN